MGHITRHLLLTTLLASVHLTNAHLSIWNKAMFGLDPTQKNTDNASQPLVGRNFDGWWFHGNIDNPPVPGTFEPVALPAAGGSIDLEISSNKGQTSLGFGLQPNPRVAPEPWTNGNSWGNMHAPKRTDVAGSALAIAYKSNPKEVKPEDFVVFSVVYDSPARQLQAFPVPAGLQACPNNVCICSWFWIHESIGGGDEMYMTPFYCTVTGAKAGSGKPLGKPIASRRCDGDGWNDEIKAQKGKCVVGAKSPMYWKNLEKMNMFEPGHWAPTYSKKYGFADGAQLDIFEDGRIAGTTPASPQPPSPPAAVTVTATVTVRERRARREFS
ncbi:hypothetical protein DFH27DRAFT_596714 [Peziza echinospora]|nr:hypothetical protein DFH27DRAFT_596714 [Peziza echinospora]